MIDGVKNPSPITIFAIVVKTARYIMALFLGILILFIQGGFYHVHDHGHEHHHACSHDDHQDSSFADDCDLCDHFAKQHYELELPKSILVVRTIESEILLFSPQFIGLSISYFSSRGPPIA